MARTAREGDSVGRARYCGRGRLAHAGKRLAAGAGAAVGLALIAVLGIGAQSAAAYTLGGGIIASYSGTWTVHYKAYTGYQEEITLTWAESYPVSGEGGEPGWELTSAAGHVSVSSSPEPKEDCSATLSVNPAGNITPAGNGSWGAGIIPENYADPAYSYSNGYWTVWNLQAPVTFGYPNDGLLSSEPYKELEYKVCANEQYYSQLGEGHYDTELAGTECHFDTNPEVRYDWISFPIGSNESANDNCEATGTDVSGNTWTAVLKSKINFYSPGGPSPGSFGTGASPPPPPPLLPQQKQEAAYKAREDLRDAAIPNLARYCGPAVAGLLGTGAGVLTGNVYLAVAGGLTAGAMNSFCGDALTRVVNDYKIYQDPPLASIETIARPAAVSTAKLQSCKRYGGKPARFCKRLRSAYTKLVGAAQQVASITAAIEETVSRERTAYEAGNETALDAQNSDLVKLLGEAPSAYAAEASAGKDVAKVLKSAHIHFELSKKRAAKAIAVAESDLGKQGITTSELSSVDSSALEPAATNLLSDLEHL